MALEESDEKLTAVEHDGMPFQFEERIKHIFDNMLIDYVESFWQKGLVIRTSVGGRC